jgi:hypothetical protein
MLFYEIGYMAAIAYMNTIVAQRFVQKSVGVGIMIVYIKKYITMFGAFFTQPHVKI